MKISSTPCKWIALSLCALLFATVAGECISEAKEVEISYWTFLNPEGNKPREQGLKKNIDRFHEKYPNIRVKVKVIPPTEIDKQIIMAVSVGKGPDVARISSLVLSQHFAADTLVSLEPYVKNWTEAQRNDFITPWDFTVHKGQKMGLFLENRTTLLQYRADLLEKAGLQVPTTLEELAVAAKKLTTARVSGFMLGLSESRRASSLQESLPPLIWSAGGDVLDADRKAAFDSPSGVKAFQWLKDLVKVHNAMSIEAVSYNMDQMQAAIKAGTVAMTTLGNYRTKGIRSAKAVGDTWKTAPVPGFGKGPAAATIFGWVLTMSKDVQHPDEAFKFIEHLISAESQEIYAMIGGEVPSRKSTYERPWFKTKDAEEMKMWKDYIDSHGRLFLWPEKYTPLAELWAKSAQQVILNDAPIKETLSNAAAAYNDMIKN